MNEYENGWILLAEDGFGTCAWGENSRLYWCGGDTYAIVFERSALNTPSKEIIIFLERNEVKEAWEREQADYDYYRDNA